MDRDTYLVLRVTGPSGEPVDPLGGVMRGGDVPLGAAPEAELKVEANVVDRQEYRELRRDPTVRSVARPMPLRLIEPVALAGPLAEPAAAFGATWGVYVTGALQSPYTGSGVTVAVLDTGIDAGHEAFAGVELVQKDFTGEGDGDRHGHGTHVAGTIFGRTSPGGQRIGVAPGVRRALIGKVLGEESGASTAELVGAIQWAVESGANIVNMSLGMDFPGLVKLLIDRYGVEADLATSWALAQYRDNVRFFDRLVGLLQARAAQLSSALLIAAAGNESRRNVRPDYTIEVAPPAAADGIVSVAALQTTGAPHDLLRIAPFSNIRAAVAGPGVGVYSARAGGGYVSFSGTSMASPHVAGVAALWAERQLQQTGAIHSGTLSAMLQGNASRSRLGDAAYEDVGEGLVSAPQA